MKAKLKEEGSKMQMKSTDGKREQVEQVSLMLNDG